MVKRFTTKVRTKTIPRGPHTGTQMKQAGKFGGTGIVWSRRKLDWENKLVATGQTTQYNSKEDDGYHEKGDARSYTVYTTGDRSGTTNITLNGKTHALSNNVVVDNRIGLMWARYVPDADIGPDNDGKLFYLDAIGGNDEDIFAFKDQANTNTLGGHSDWRVPNFFELVLLLDFSVYAATPIIDSTTFPSTPNGEHWTSTVRPATDGGSMYVNFSNALCAYSDKDTLKHYCRLVRDA